MAKRQFTEQFTEEDDALLAELGIEIESKSKASRTPREERIIAGFEEIQQFFETHQKLPQHGQDKDIFERMYAVRLEKIRTSSECKGLLTPLDKYGLLSNVQTVDVNAIESLDDDALLAELSILHKADNDITTLKYVKSVAEKKAAEQIGGRSLCHDFETFKPLFVQIQSDLKNGIRKTSRFKQDTGINQGEYFILGGQIAFIAEVGERKKDDYGKEDARLRIIFDNGTQSNILLRSLQKYLYKDEAGRRITDYNAGPLFDQSVEDADIETGTVYVLRSKSEQSEIQSFANLLHKIGVTGGNVATRISNAKFDPTFLMAEVEIIATYELYNINRIKLENLLHRFFDSARLNIQINDRFGKPINPREWFLVPLFIIDEVVEKVKNGTLNNYFYDVNLVKLIPSSSDVIDNK